MKFTTVKAMKMCPMPFCEGWLTLLEWAGNWWTTYRGPQDVSLPAVWKHTVPHIALNPECAYEERIA